MWYFFDMTHLVFNQCVDEIISPKCCGIIIIYAIQISPTQMVIKHCFKCFMQSIRAIIYIYVSKQMNHSYMNKYNPAVFPLLRMPDVYINMQFRIRQCDVLTVTCVTGATEFFDAFFLNVFISISRRIDRLNRLATSIQCFLDQASTFTII